MKYFSWIAIVFVAAAVVFSFFVIGSPAHQRLVRFDERRLNDLQNIQYQVSSYYAAKAKLPATLADMKGFEGYSVPLDPETNEPYMYSVKGAMEFQLCANFALESKGQGEEKYMTSMPYGGNSNNWKHGAGKGCFNLKLEKVVEDGHNLPPLVTVTPVV